MPGETVEPRQPDEGGSYICSGSVQMADEGRVGPGPPDLAYDFDRRTTTDYLRHQVRAFLYMGGMPSMERLIEFQLRRHSRELYLKGYPIGEAPWCGRSWWNEWYWTIRDSSHPGVPESARRYVGGMLPDAAQRMGATWGYDIEYLGPRPDGPPEIYDGKDFHSYQVTITLDGEQEIEWTAFWGYPPQCLDLYNVHHARTLTMMSYLPYKDGGLMALPLRSTIGPTCGALAATWNSDGELEARAWPWASQSELDDWTGGGSYQIRRALAGEGATYNVAADGVVSGGRLWSPVVSADDGVMMWRGWSYGICELASAWRGDVLDMYTNPVTGVPWIAWWAGGVIYVAHLDEYATDTWSSPTSVADLEDCVGIGITGDGRIMRVAGTDSDGQVREWHSEDNGVTWGDAVTVNG